MSEFLQMSCEAEQEPTEPVRFSQEELNRTLAKRYRKHHLNFLLVCVFTVAASLFLTPASPFAGKDDPVRFLGYRIPGSCPSSMIYNVECPGCGMTRSFVAIAHGKWFDAFLFNGAGPALFFLVLLQIPFRIYRLTSSPEPLNLPQPLWVTVPPKVVFWFMLLNYLVKIVFIESKFF